MFRRTLAIVALLLCCTVTRLAADPFTKLEAAIKKQTMKNPELGKNLLGQLSAVRAAFKKKDAEEGNRILDRLGGDIFDSTSKGQTPESVVNILEAAHRASDILFANKWIDHYWTRMYKFPNRRCENNSCRQADEHWDCYMVEICGEYKGCEAVRK